MWGMAGLGFRKKTPEQKKYANFNRRMFATTLDFAIVGMVFAPLMDKIFMWYHGPSPLNHDVLRQKIAAAPAGSSESKLFMQYAMESGAWDYWLQNASMQFSILFFLIGVCWHFWGATPGKMIARIKIVDAKTEQKISDMQIILRLGGYMMSATFFLLGFLWIGIDKRKQGWHDKFADTVVITLPWKLPKLGL